MARNLIVNGVTYNGVEALEMTDVNGEKVRYSEGGGGGTQPSASTKAVNFRDYDGTPLYSYTAEEALALSELPPLPSREGLICQEWNWSLADMQEYVAEYGVCEIGATYITDDGKTRIYITLTEGRTSPMLGCCPNGTVAVDWGDGTAPDILTGTSVTAVKWTPTHEYAKPGDYIITLTVDGTMGLAGYSGTNQNAYILRNSTGNDARNMAYLNAIKRVEIGDGVTDIGPQAFKYCRSLTYITIPNCVKNTGNYAFQYCLSLVFAIIPNGITTVSAYLFYQCQSITSVILPKTVAVIGGSAFNGCDAIKYVLIPDSVTSYSASMFYDCRTLESCIIPDSVTSIGDSVFYGCGALGSITIPENVNFIGVGVVRRCHSLASIAIPKSVATIGTNAFNECWGMRYCDFSNHTEVPSLIDANAFTGIPDDCEIRVPAALYNEWIAATNWSAVADNIVGV